MRPAIKFTCVVPFSLAFPQLHSVDWPALDGLVLVSCMLVMLGPCTLELSERGPAAAGLSPRCACALEAADWRRILWYPSGDSIVIG
jgi:hypothetical protein